MPQSARMIWEVRKSSTRKSELRERHEYTPRREGLPIPGEIIFLDDGGVQTNGFVDIAGLFRRNERFSSLQALLDQYELDRNPRIEEQNEEASFFD